MANLRTSAAYRIAFTYAAAFAAAILLLGVAVYFAADAEFRQQRDQTISDEIADLAQEGRGQKLAREIAEREAGRTTHSFGYALFDSNGKRISGALDTARPPTGFSMIIFRDPVEGPDAARAKAIDLPSGERLVVAVDSEAIETIDATILTLFGTAFVIVLVIGAAGALLLGRYLRHRLGAIEVTANAIVAGDLAQRMPVGPNRDEFDTAALALNAMLDRIAGLMENLRQVSSDVAHDLRTPLLRLRSQLEQVGKVDGAAQRAIDQGEELLKLFGSILRIAEVEGGGLEQGFTRIDLSALAEDVADSFLPALSDSGRNFCWTVTPDIIVRGDRELLAQAIANLLDNTRIHTPIGTNVILLLETSPEWIRLSVADNGPGVPAADSQAILRRFHRTEASRTTPGNGLGLSLVTA
ncbi:MAG: HAMP domain-containing sensor histidine kinase, partial [Pseudomonadota bacterium]